MAPPGRTASMCGTMEKENVAWPSPLTAMPLTPNSPSRAVSPMPRIVALLPTALTICCSTEARRIGSAAGFVATARS